jgi:hypothetical protein
MKVSVEIQDFKPLCRKTLRGFITTYTPILEFVDKQTRDAFNARVVAAVLQDFPDAFECQEAA